MNAVKEKKTFQVFKTENQRKKHISQMTDAEIKFLNEKLDKIGFIKKSYHLQNRKDTGTVPIQVFKKILSNPLRRNIVEYNETTKHGLLSKRILVRDSRAVPVEFYQSHDIKTYGEAVLCFVIDYETGIIITAYYNFLNDEHITLDMDRYDETLSCINEKRA